MIIYISICVSVFMGNLAINIFNIKNNQKLIKFVTIVSET